MSIKMMPILLLCSSMLAGQPANARGGMGQGTSSADANPAPAAAPAAERKICRSMTPTGSIMAKRVCLTKQQWAEFREGTARAAENLRDHQHGYDPRLGN